MFSFKGVSNVCSYYCVLLSLLLGERHPSEGEGTGQGQHLCLDMLGYVWLCLVGYAWLCLVMFGYAWRKPELPTCITMVMYTFTSSVDV